MQVFIWAYVFISRAKTQEWNFLYRWRIFNFIRNYQTVFQWFYNYTLSPAMYESSSFSIFSPIVGTVIIIVVIYYFKFQAYVCLIFFIFISLMNSNIKYILYVLIVHSYMKGLFKSLGYFLIVIFLLIIELQWFIMFWIKILCQIYAFQTFSLGVYFAFQFPESSLLKCDIFVVYMKSTL